MDEWATTKQASGKVFLTAHHIAELARHEKIVADRTGEKKWLVKVTLKDGKWELVRADKPKQKPANSTQFEQGTAHTPAYEEFLAFLREWRKQVQFSSLSQLLDEALFRNRREDYDHRVIESGAVEDAYLGGIAHHFEALPRPLKTMLPCENTALFTRLKGLYPESGVWKALELFDQVYGEYWEASSSWMVMMKRQVKSLISRLTKVTTSDKDIEASTSWQVVVQVFNEAKRIDRDYFLLLIVS